jgi:WhiB family redox-sensing transcriptional regulator
MMRRDQALPGTWAADALCAEVDPSIFFPDDEHHYVALDAAKRVCGRCAVAAECLAYALATDQRYGVWGGLTRHERIPLGVGQVPVV